MQNKGGKVHKRIFRQGHVNCDRLTLLQITINSEQNTKNKYLKAMENEQGRQILKDETWKKAPYEKASFLFLKL